MIVVVPAPAMASVLMIVLTLPLTVSVAEIEIAEFTTMLLTASIPLGTVTVSPPWKFVFAPVMVTVI